MDNTIELSAIIPIYNEESILNEVLNNFASAFDATVGKDRWQFILVENGSSDSSPRIIEESKKKWPQTVTANLPVSNYGNALREGMLLASAPFSLILNADHAWDAPFFKWAWENRNDYEMILGSKSADLSLNSQTSYRKLLSAGLNALLRYLVDFPGADSHGMKLMQTSMVKPLAELCVMRRGQFDSELVIRSLRKGFNVVEVPVFYSEKRSPRNFMFKKILQNCINLFSFSHAMKTVFQEGPLQYKRLSRSDVELGRKIV